MFFINPIVYQIIYRPKIMTQPIFRETSEKIFINFFKF